jgi:two-component system response regulator NreC
VPPRADLREVVFPSRKIRCVLVHDHVLLRHGLRRLLEDEPDIDVVGEAGNAAECLRKVYEFRPDVLIADVETFEQPAPEAELLVERESLHTRIVFLSMQERGISPFGLQDATGSCAVRQTSAGELVEMIRNSSIGMPTDGLPANDNPTSHIPTGPIPTSHVPTSHRDTLSRRDTQRSNERPFPPERALTAREREVLKLLAEGKTVREAAAILGVSSKTVDAHKFNLMRKLGIHNKAELVMWAIQKRVLKLPANY